METAQPESEKAGSQSTPPAMNTTPPETFAQASSPSFPLLRRLRVRSKWKAKWSRRGKQRENDQHQEEHDQEEAEEAEDSEDSEENDNESIIVVEQDSRSGSTYSSYMTDNIPHWKAAWNRVRMFLPKIKFRYFLRFIPMIGIHHILMITSAVAITMLFAGCSSHRMRNIYLLEVSYHHGQSDSSLEHGSAISNPAFYSLVANISSTTDLTVRVGYFGVCMATQEGENTSLSWSCRSKASDLAGQVTSLQDPLNILAIGDNFRDEIIVSVIVIMSIIPIFFGFYILSTFPGWHEEVDGEGDEVEVKPFPSLPVVTIALAFYVLAELFLVVAILWQHVAVVAHSATTQAVFNGAVRGDVGAVAMGLGWGAIGANLVTTLGLTMMILSLRILRDLTDYDSV
ncbi:Ca2+ regulator and membrane fusion protein Fig1-domain-containing protein [Aspergillus granulosus]|uniref:Ca2+ regulator and membrane fusion protein Fig1-domain-containing protein n=1 Tax=Aspergillus granulosus TaxID=176169 RepID=A0ABR4GTL7_9EURO